MALSPIFYLSAALFFLVCSAHPKIRIKFNDASELIPVLERHHAHVLLLHPTRALLDTFAGRNVSLTLSVPDPITRLIDDADDAKDWIHENVERYVRDTTIEGVSVGDAAVVCDPALVQSAATATALLEAAMLGVPELSGIAVFAGATATASSEVPVISSPPPFQLDEPVVLPEGRVMSHATLIEIVLASATVGVLSALWFLRMVTQRAARRRAGYERGGFVEMQRIS